MSKGLIFSCCAYAILLFTIVNLSVGPIISGKVGTDDDFYWGTMNCEYYNDRYDEDKKTLSGDDLKYGAEWQKKECQAKKGMHDMEYTSFIFDIVIGFVCGLLGLLHLFDTKKEFVPKTGLIGLGCGIVGFALTFVYVIFNGIVYTTYHDYDNGEFKRDDDSSFAVKDSSGNFKCTYFEDNNPHSVYAKYSDLSAKKYNYDKDLVNSLSQSNCVIQRLDSDICSSGTIDSSDFSNYGISGSCSKLYVEPGTEILNKDKSDRFLTALILSLFVCLANIGLAIFGFLLFRTPSDF